MTPPTLLGVAFIFGSAAGIGVWAGTRLRGPIAAFVLACVVTPLAGLVIALPLAIGSAPMRKAGRVTLVEMPTGGAALGLLAGGAAALVAQRRSRRHAPASEEPGPKLASSLVATPARAMKGGRTEIPAKRRWQLYGAAWGAAALSFFLPPLLHGVIPDVGQVFILVAFSWLFPTGLSALIGRPRPLDDIVLLVLFWLAYVVHGVYTLKSRTTARFYAFLLVLAVVLALNVAGCHCITVNARPFG